MRMYDYVPSNRSTLCGTMPSVNCQSNERHCICTIDIQESQQEQIHLPSVPFYNRKQPLSVPTQPLVSIRMNFSAPISKT